MAILIRSNDNGRCILFEGSSQPAYWYACLTAEVDGEDATRINVINDVRTATNGVTEYEFYKMPFTEFVDEDGVAFSDAPAVATYINDRVNPSTSTGGTSFAQTESMDFERDATNTTVMFSNGDTHGVNSIHAVEENGTISIKTTKADVVLYSGLNHDNLTIAEADAGGSISNVVNNLNNYFSVTPVAQGGDYSPSYVADGGAPVTGNDAEGTVPTTGTPTHILTTGSDTSSGHGARYWSDETIDQAGEYFTVKLTGQGRAILALSDTNDSAMQTALVGNSGNGHTGITWGLAIYDYGSYKAPWTTYGTGGLSYGPGWTGATTGMMRYNTTVQNAFDNMDPVLFKVGINNDGYISVWYWDDGRSNDWILCGRRGTTTAASSYRLVVKLWDANGTLVETPVVHLLEPAAPELIYNYIESPDGVFSYPLFSSAEQAEYIDTDNGGAGNSQIVTFPDDTVLGRTWYAPTTGYTYDGTAAPTDTSTITWNEIPTQADSLFAPAPFAGLDHTFDEGAAINLQLIPADATFNTTVSISPALPGVSLVDANLEGTAPEVAGDNVTNPSDTYTVTVTHTNSYGSSTGSFDLIINNLTAPTTALAGFTHVAGTTALVDSDTLDDGSAVTLDDTLQSIRRFIIPKVWVETYVLPFITNAGTGTNPTPGTGPRAYFGIKAAAGDLTDGITDSDFDGFIAWEYQSSTTHMMRMNNGSALNVGIGSTTNALYDFAIEVDGTDVHFIACNANSIMNEPSVNNGGSFSHVRTISGYTGTLPATLVIGTNGTQIDFSDTYLAEVEVNLPPRWVQVTGNPSHTLNFDGSTTMPTLQAGYTYRFLMADVEHKDGTTATGLHVDDDLRFTADGTTEYTTGITRVGNPNDVGAYVEFAVPADVPPLQWYTDHNTISAATGFSISGSTYVTPVTGVTIEGPAGNFTGNVINSGSNGWLSLNETLSPGERLVLDSAFIQDLNAALPDHCTFWVGLKDASWTDTGTPTSAFYGNAAVRFWSTSSSETGVYIFGYAGSGTTATQSYVPLIDLADSNAFIEVTSSGDNIRVGFNNGASLDSATSTAYADWTADKKVKSDGLDGTITGATDVMIYWQALSGNTVGFDISDVDWTGLSEVSVPTAAVANDTSWTKALDFSGSNERCQQVTNDNNRCPLRMSGINNNAAAPATAGYTSNDSNARPWATSIVFKAHTYNDNQHVWNLGEGAGDADDNIYLRRDASRNLWFGWGRSGEVNECFVGYIGGNIGGWWGVYIASNGTRLGSGHSAADIAAAFDIRMVNLSTGATGSNLSTSTNWTSGSFGARMNRQFTGDMTIGGRGPNRSFRGKVAAMVVTTLRRNVAMPTDAEIGTMVTDPVKWLTDYKAGNAFRLPWQGTDAGFNFALNDGSSSYGTQVWLMGDGPNDVYAQIRNHVWPASQNYTPMNMISMVSNDIETVNIPGLT